MGGKRNIIEMFGSFMEPFICVVSCQYVIQLFSDCYGAIVPTFAESAVTPQANKQTSRVRLLHAYTLVV